PLNLLYSIVTGNPANQDSSTADRIELNLLRPLFSADTFLETPAVRDQFPLAVGFLLAKTTCLYLLLLFRGTLSLETLFGGARFWTGSPPPATISDHLSTTGFHFVAPYLVGNCFTLFG